MENSTDRQTDGASTDEERLAVATKAAERLESVLSVDWTPDAGAGFPRVTTTIGSRSVYYLEQVTVEEGPFGWSGRFRTCTGREFDSSGRHTHPEEALAALLPHICDSLQRLMDEANSALEHVELHRSLYEDRGDDA